MAIFKARYSRQGLWLLFSTCAFPIHVWTLILFFQDISWVTERTNSWDAIGVGSYGLLIAFFESVFVFVIALLLGFLVPRNWDKNKRVAVLGWLALITAVWAILDQLYFLTNFQFPSSLLQVMLKSGHPLWILNGLVLGGAILTTLLPVIRLMKSEKFGTNINAFMERITTLSALYLFLDFCGLIVVIIRNV